MFCLVCITVCIEDSRAMPAKENDGYRTALLSFCRFVRFHFLFSLKGCWSRVYERVKRMRDIRWMLRCVDIDDGKALKSKTGRIELWLSEDRLKIVKRHAVDRLRSRTFCDSADLIRTRVVGYSRWELHLGNLIRSKLCSVDSIRILLDFFKLFIATVEDGSPETCVPFAFHRSRVRVYVRVFFLSSPNDFCRLVRRRADTLILRLCGRSNCKKGDICTLLYVRWCI